MNESKIIQQLEQSEIPMVTTGRATNLHDFFEKVILQQFNNASSMKNLHNELITYVNLSRPTFFIRAHGSYTREKYGLLRRGFLSRYPSGVEYAFCDNTFALLFASMKFSDQVLDADEMLQLFQIRKVQCGYGQTSPERDLALFTPEGAFQSTINANGWYLAHIFPVGADYVGYSYQSDRNSFFPGGAREDWQNPEKIRKISEGPTHQEIELLRAHFLRLCHPLNSFLVPKKSLLKYSNGSLIGEEPALIELVSNFIAQSFPTEYQVFKKHALAGEVPKPFLTDITDIEWGTSVVSAQAIKKRKPVVKNRINPEPQKIQQTDTLSLLRKIGSETFVYFFLPLWSNPQISTENLVRTCPNYHSWTEGTKRTKASTSRRIFRENRAKEALEIIVTQNLDQNLIQLTTRYLEELFE